MGGVKSTRSVPATRAALAPLAAALAALLPVACGTGQQVAAGPIFAYVVGRGGAFGWEAGGAPITVRTGAADPVPGSELILARFSTGMTWRRQAAGAAGFERISYVAWEPWFWLGGTLGVAHSSADGRIRPLLGAWEAVPWVFGGSPTNGMFLRCAPCFTISLSIGWRWGGAGEFFMSPKVGVLNDVTKPFPFQQYAD